MNGRVFDRDDCFVTTEELKKKFTDSKLFLFGVGQEATKLEKNFPKTGSVDILIITAVAEHLIAIGSLTWGNIGKKILSSLSRQQDI